MSLGTFFDSDDKLREEHERFRKCLVEMAKEKPRKPEWYQHVARVALDIPKE